MFDFVGNRIDVGDRVVYCRVLSSKAVMEDVDVLGFTETMVKITPLSCKDAKRGYSLCNPDRLVVFEKVGR